MVLYQIIWKPYRLQDSHSNNTTYLELFNEVALYMIVVSKVSFMGVIDETNEVGAGWLMISLVVLLTAFNLLNLLKAVVNAFRQYN